MSLTETGLDLRARSPLAKVDSVALLTGRPVRTIYQMTDGGDLIHGHLQWVWNVAVDPAGKIRDLRYWVGEALAPERQRGLELDTVIDFILPPRRREFAAGELQQLLQVRDNTLLELRSQMGGALRAHCNFYPRAAVADFFRRRWLGAEPARASVLTSKIHGGQA